MLITAWDEIKVEGGVLYVSFRSGPTEYCVAMGPAMAFTGIDRVRKALARGIVEQLLGDEPTAH